MPSLKINRVAFALTALNIIAMLAFWSQVQVTSAQAVPDVLRAKGLQIVDDRGMLIQPANDYSLSPSAAMERELSRLSKPHVRKIYPAFGDTQLHGHNFLYFDIARWEQDVFAFLEANLTRQN